MHAQRAMLLAAILLPLSCSNDSKSAEAARVFEAFQLALQQRDESACRQTLTVESGDALTAMPWDRVAQQQPLRVTGVARNRNSWRVQVVDPNSDNDPGEFVVVREYGRLVVDLVASAGLTAEIVEATGSKHSFEPRALTPADYDRLRDHELRQPPR